MAENRMLSDEILLGLIKKNSGGGGGGGTDDYNDLSNQPQIEGVTLSGNKSASDLGLATTTDLAGKQDTLSAGDYIQFDGNEISVNREIPNETVSYEFKTKGTSEPNIAIIVTKRSNSSVVWEREYQYLDVLTPIVIDDVIKFGYQWVNAGQWTYEMLVASDSHAVGYRQSWGYLETKDYTEDFSLIDNTGLKLIIKSEMDTALADKQDKTDNSLQTTDKTVVGAVNELKRGLTNLHNDVEGAWEELTFASVVTLSQDVTTTGTPKAYRRGNRIRLYFDVTGTLTVGAGGYKTIGTLKTAYKPTRMNYLPTIANRANSGIIMYPFIYVVSSNSGNINLIAGPGELGNANNSWMGNDSVEMVYELS